jgi:hypothetical protein
MGKPTPRGTPGPDHGRARARRVCQLGGPGVPSMRARPRRVQDGASGAVLVLGRKGDEEEGKGETDVWAPHVNVKEEKGNRR